MKDATHIELRDAEIIHSSYSDGLMEIGIICRSSDFIGTIIGTRGLSVTIKEPEKGKPRTKTTQTTNKHNL